MKRNFRFLILLTFALCGIQKVRAQAPTSLQYPTPNGFIANISNVFLSPTYAGLTATSFSITPTLPAGLSFDVNTGVISGVPTTASPSTNYIITAANGSGSGKDTIAIAVGTTFFNNNFNPIAFRLADTVRKVGTGITAGSIILYKNVTSANGQAIDCIVKTVSFTQNTVWDAYDQPLASSSFFSSNKDSFFSPQLRFPTGGGNVIFNFQFIAGNTYDNATNSGTNVTLQNIRLNTYDIDGNNSAGSNQYNRFNGFDTSELGSGTTLEVPTFNAATGLTQFRSSIDTNSTIVTADRTRVRLSYQNISNYTIQVGSDAGAASSSNSSLAYFFLDFSNGPAFTTAVKTGAPAIDLNTSIPGVGNGGTGCASPIAFVPSGQSNLAAAGTLNKLNVIYQNTTANLPNTTNELLLVNGGTGVGSSRVLNFTTAPSNTSVTLGGITYTVRDSANASTNTNTISFSVAGGFTVAQGNALLQALRYDNNGTSPIAGSRQFVVNVENSAFRSPDAAFTATVNCVGISGNIFHDANGLRDGIVNSNFNTGTALPANGAYAVLTNTSGTVLASQGIDANGTYSFGRNEPGNYNIYVRNAPATVGATNFTTPSYPAGGYVSTGENLGATAGNDGLIDGKLVVTLGSIAVANANFGIQIPPTAANSTLSSVANPGGFNSYTIPAGSFTAADADGSLDSMLITAFPTNTNYLQVGTGANKVVYTNGGTCPPQQSICTPFPAGGLKIPYADVTTLAVDPTATGNTSVVITFQVIDNGSARSAATNTLTLPFTVPATPLTVTGNVWNDNNGNGLKDAGEVFSSTAGTGQTLYALLVQTSNTYSGNPTVYASVPVTVPVSPAVIGYTFSDVPANNTYEVRIVSLATQPTAGMALSMITPALAPTYTGVSTNNGGTVTASQNTINLVNILGTVTTNKAAVNFGMEQRPTADGKAFTALNGAFTPSATVSIGGQPASSIPASSTQLTGSATKSLSGSDPEDCATASSCTTNRTFQINTINANTRVYYNGSNVTAGSNISNFDIANLTIYGQQGQGYTSATALGFTYSLVDAAGIASSPVAYSLQTASAPLPIVLKSFAGTVNNCVAHLRWETTSETPHGRYEVEQSATGASFKTVETVWITKEATNLVRQTTVTDLNQVNYFRLKLVDERGEATYSQTLILNGGDCARSAVTVGPNPTANRVNISGLQGSGNTIVVYSSLGALISKATANSTTETVDLSNYAAGLYLIQVVSAEGNLLHTARIEKQ